MMSEDQEKKTKKSKRTGHLKERNHFDGKDMLLLVVMLIIIYGIMSWVEFFAQEKINSQNNDPQTTIETSATDQEQEEPSN